MPNICRLAGNAMRLGLLPETVRALWSQCQDPSSMLHLQGPEEHWGGEGVWVSVNQRDFFPYQYTPCLT